MTWCSLGYGCRPRSRGFGSTCRGEWRGSGYPGITAVTRELLDYWIEPDREKPLFFCQIEALETAIFLAEVAGRTQPWIENRLREENQAKNPGLYRIAFKMATGSGKTVVMAMLIAWQALNKLANPQDKRFSDTFLIVTPGITIRDRLQVLRPNLPGNYYRRARPRHAGPAPGAPGRADRDHELPRLHPARHASRRPRSPRRSSPAPTATSTGSRRRPSRWSAASAGRSGPRRTSSSSTTRPTTATSRRPRARRRSSRADERAEAKRDEEAARVWLNGLRAVGGKIGIRAIYDLSATPFFLRGSGYPRGHALPVGRVGLQPDRRDRVRAS